MTCGPNDEAADSTSGLATASSLEARDSVDGDKKGPVSNEQPAAHPVAAGPAKVGEYSPKLDEVTADVDALAELASVAIARPQTTTRTTAIDNRKLNCRFIGFLQLIQS
jgi:hypothetical protein